MSKVLHVTDVHSFPVTAIDFNQEATLVLSGSADGTIVAAKVPEFVEGNGIWGGLCWLILFTLLAILVILAFMPFEEFVDGHPEL